jgi:hypothetical protein
MTSFDATHELGLDTEAKVNYGEQGHARLQILVRGQRVLDLQVSHDGAVNTRTLSGHAPSQRVIDALVAASSPDVNI